MVKETFDIAFIIEKMPAILSALPVTLEITGLSLIAGWAIGLIAAWGKVKGPAPIKSILRVLTDILRGIPTVVLLYLVYFGILQLVDSTHLSKIFFVVVALAIEFGTTSSEMFRSAFNSIKKGQVEAAHALGYTGWQTFVHVIAPQGLYVITPNMGSAVLSLIQATALVYSLGVFDILGKARQIDTTVSNVKTFEMYFAVGLIYWVIAIAVQKIFKLIEKNLKKGVER